MFPTQSFREYLLDVFIHSSSSLLAILQSGQFIGTNKALAKLGKESRGATGSPPNVTMFVKWGVQPLAVSFSRIRRVVGREVSGALVFTDPLGKIGQDIGYPQVVGDEFQLSELSLRAIIADAGDMYEPPFDDPLANPPHNAVTYGRDIEPYIQKIKGDIFGFYLEDDLSDLHRVEAILKECERKGCFT